MSFTDDARRWVRDRFAPRDEYINGTPREKISEAVEALPGLTHHERTRAYEHVRAYTTNYHLSRHDETVPHETAQMLSLMERRIERLRAVDNAREVLARYGGPPTLQTISEALERSQKERETHAHKERQVERESHREKLKETVRQRERMKL